MDHIEVAAGLQTRRVFRCSSVGFPGPVEGRPAVPIRANPEIRMRPS